MTATLEQPESEEMETLPLTVEQLQAILDGHTQPGMVKISEPAPCWLRYDLATGFSISVSDSELASDRLTYCLRDIGRRILAAADAIDAAAGYDTALTFDVSYPHGHLVNVSGMGDEVDIHVINALDDEDAIRKAREAIAFVTNGKQPWTRPKPENAGPIELTTLRPMNHQFGVSCERFHDVWIKVINEPDESAALTEATAFIEWLQAQAAPQTASEPALMIA